MQNCSNTRFGIALAGTDAMLSTESVDNLVGKRLASLLTPGVGLVVL